MKTIIKTSLLLLIWQITFAQSDSSMQLLQKVRAKLDKVQDYSVSIKVKVDINFLKVKEMKARLYYKKPDKTKMEAEGFALIPKASLDFYTARLLNSDYISVFVKKDTIDAQPLAVVKLIPRKEGGRIILATLWIDLQDYVIKKLEAATSDNGTFGIRFKYGAAIDYGLPDQSDLSFNVKKGGFSHFAMPDKEKDTSGSLRKKLKKQMQGHVQIFYSDYKINSGLSDSFFEEAKNHIGD